MFCVFTGRMFDLFLGRERSPPKIMFWGVLFLIWEAELQTSMSVIFALQGAYFTVPRHLRHQNVGGVSFSCSLAECSIYFLAGREKTTENYFSVQNFNFSDFGIPNCKNRRREYQHCRVLTLPFHATGDTKMLEGSHFRVRWQDAL